jgi:hypothetical protein
MARGISRRTVAEEPVEETEEALKGRRSIGNKRSDAGEETESAAPNIGSEGWEGYDKESVGSSAFPDRFTLTTKKQVIHFVDEKPFFNWKQHWINRTGKRSWTCLKTEENPTGCPLCESLGDKAATQTVFNVVVFDKEGEASLTYWQVGKGFGDTIRQFVTEKATNPLNKADLYFTVARSDGKGAKDLYMQAVKARDLEEDWDIVPLSDEELVEFESQKHDKSIIKIDTRKQLREIVDEEKDQDD